MCRTKVCGILFLILLSGFCHGQITRHHGVFWGRIVLNDKISENWKWELYLQKRTQNIPGEKSIFGAPHFQSAWLWFNYTVSKNLKLSFSPFGYFDSYTFLTESSDLEIPGVKEFRWVARLEQEQRFKFFNYSNRFSFEYRRRDLLNNDVYRPNWRLRFMPKLEKQVKGLFSCEKAVTFFIADEVFLQFGKAVRNNPNVFDQNRISTGASYEIFKNVRASVSYLNIIQERNNGKDFDDAHVLWVVLTSDNIFSQFKSHSRSADNDNSISENR